MLLVSTHLGKSDIEGMGVFSAENLIVKGQPIWIKGPLDISVNQKDIPVELRDYFDKYATVEGPSYPKYHLDGDDCKFMNHSNTPNILFTETLGIALSDIELNEELTCDYRTITIPEHFEYLMTIKN